MEVNPKDAIDRAECCSVPVVGIVLVYGGTENLEECLASLGRQSRPFASIVVIDNGSPRPLDSEIARRWPEVIVRRNERNLGYAGGNNRAIREALGAGAHYVFLANDDTVLAEDALERMVQACEQDPSIGAAGPTLLYYDRPDIIIDRGRMVDDETADEIYLDRGLSKNQGHHEELEVDCITGCGLLLRAETLGKVGLLDERFFLNYEETDLCRRIARAGQRVVCIPSAEMWHKIASSFGRLPSPLLTYYLTRNRWLFMSNMGKGAQATREALRVLRKNLRAYVGHWRRCRRVPLVTVVENAAVMAFLLRRFGAAPRWLEDRLAAGTSRGRR